MIDAPGLDDFVGVAGRRTSRPGIARSDGELLDRLMRRPVLADADRIVREDVDDRQFHDRRQPDRRPAVVAEDEERRAVGPHLGQRHAVEDRAHGVLADAEVEVAAAVVAGLEIAGAVEGQQRLGRRGQVGRRRRSARARSWRWR